MNKKASLVLLFMALGFFAFASNPDALLKEGMDRYSRGEWQAAIISLRQARSLSSDLNIQTEALYWTALSEIALSDFEGAWEDLDTLIQLAPAHNRAKDSIYQKGRILYYQGEYEASISVMKTYVDLVNDQAKESAATYWVGESLFALGRMDEARSLFTMITEKWPSSIKFEAASYRIALIDQKAVEQELLTLLKWTHEESLKTLEEYQRRERSYEQAIIVYQKRIADMLKDTRLADLETENRSYRLKISELEQQLADQSKKNDREMAALRANLRDVEEALQKSGASYETNKIEAEPPPAPELGSNSVTRETPEQGSFSSDDVMDRIEALRLQALRIQEALMEKIEREGRNEQ